MATKKKPPEPDHRTCRQCLHCPQIDGAQEPLGERYFNPPMLKEDEDGGGYSLIRPILEPGEHACARFFGCN